MSIDTDRHSKLKRDLRKYTDQLTTIDEVIPEQNATVHAAMTNIADAADPQSPKHTELADLMQVKVVADYALRESEKEKERLHERLSKIKDEIKIIERKQRLVDEYGFWECLLCGGDCMLDDEAELIDVESALGAPVEEVYGPCLFISPEQIASLNLNVPDGDGRSVEQQLHEAMDSDITWTMKEDDEVIDSQHAVCTD